MPFFNSPNENQPEMALPEKRKRKLNPKLISEDNVHEEAVKRRKATATKAPTRKEVPVAQKRAPSPQPESVVESDVETEPVDTASRGGSVREPSIVGARHSVEIEEIDDSDIEEVGLQEETDEQELGKLDNHTLEHPD
jgi:hypothetical protein